MTIESRSLKDIILKLGRSSGKDFFNNMTLSLSDAIKCDYVFVATINKEKHTASTISLSANNVIVDNFEYDLQYTPCEEVANQDVCCHTSNITSLYPRDQLLIDMNIESYVGVPLYDSHENVLGLVVALHTKPILNDKDVISLFELFSVRIALELERINLENFDYLTHLYSKSYLRKLLLEEKERVLIIADINSFSYINEAYGFELGNEILIKVASVMKSQFSEHISAQLDSDKYILLFDKLDSIEDKIKEIQHYFYLNAITVNNITMYISFSFGVAFGKKHLLRTASVALKNSKNRGRNSYIILNTEEEETNFHERERFIEANNIVHQAIANDTVIPFFQGIRDNRTSEIRKFEALIRIKHKDEILSPFHFLEAARLSGMLPELTKIMIEKSFVVMQNKTYSFSLNITEDDLNFNYLADYLREKCEKYNINSERVVLEVLEGISSESKSEHIIQLKELKQLGFKIAIDDFGAENSNFERLLDLDIDFLKIDARYIKNIHKDDKSLAIVKAIVNFTKPIGIVCIAEFVHCTEVQNIIEELGIEYSQGYLFSEPKILE
ncbi:EAL domain-containing protein [Sulfurimonas sp.]|nr:EAL domain-containing protein [Sulfurimonas sp.]